MLFVFPKRKFPNASRTAKNTLAGRVFETSDLDSATVGHCAVY